MNDIVSNVCVYDLEETMKACRYPMTTDTTNVESDDKRLITLAKCDSSEGHDNALCGIRVAFDLKFSIKAWVEAERYHFFDIVSSQSTMHRITKFDLDEAFNEYVSPSMIWILKDMVCDYNTVDKWWDEWWSDDFGFINVSTNESEIISKEDWKKRQYLRILYSCPTGLMLTARITTNYRQLKTIYKQRKNHRLPEWREFCKWVETLPYARELILNKGD